MVSIVSPSFHETSFGIYIHWPFCKAKCPYCDFNSHVREKIEEASWENALIQSLKALHSETAHKTVTSVFFGGGTPSLMNPKTVDALISTIHRLWKTAPNLEVSLEANPTSIELGKFRDFRAAGVNRLSVGIQSLRDDSLKFLGREHFAGDAIKALEIAKSVFDRYSFDLIYALPHQTLDSWDHELDHALTLAGDHISLYQLTIEEGTQFHTRYQRGDFQLPLEELGADLYEHTISKLKAHGFNHYEVSNFAKPGYECRHNLTYWRYQDFGGVGPGAHGRLTMPGNLKVGTYEAKAPETWLELVTSTGSGRTKGQEISKTERLHEMTLMGLRLEEGLSLERIQDELGQPLTWDQIFEEKFLVPLIQEGLLELNETHLKATKNGMRVLNSLLPHIRHRNSN